METGRFSQLWEETKNSMNCNIRVFVENNNSDIVNVINTFYHDQILDKLWFSEVFVNDYNQYMAILKADCPEKYDKVKQFFYGNCKLISQDKITAVMKGIILSGSAGSFVWGVLKKNVVAMIAAVSLGVLYKLLNKKLQDVFLSKVAVIVSQRLDEIGDGVKAILRGNS